MNQIAFTIGSKPIHWYGVCIARGFLIATGLMLWKRDYAKMTKDQIIDVAMLSIFTGILGARYFMWCNSGIKILPVIHSGKYSVLMKADWFFMAVLSVLSRPCVYMAN